MNSHVQQVCVTTRTLKFVTGNTKYIVSQVSRLLSFFRNIPNPFRTKWRDISQRNKKHRGTWKRFLKNVLARKGLKHDIFKHVTLKHMTLKTYHFDIFIDKTLIKFSLHLRTWLGECDHGDCYLYTMFWCPQRFGCSHL